MILKILINIFLQLYIFFFFFLLKKTLGYFWQKAFSSFMKQFQEQA